MENEHKEKKDNQHLQEDRNEDFEIFVLEAVINDVLLQHDQ